MTQVEKKAKTLYESIKYSCFITMEYKIEEFSAKNMQEERIKMGILYNQLQAIIYKIKRLDLSSTFAKKE